MTARDQRLQIQQICTRMLKIKPFIFISWPQLEKVTAVLFTLMKMLSYTKNKCEESKQCVKEKAEFWRSCWKQGSQIVNGSLYTPVQIEVTLPGCCQFAVTTMQFSYFNLVWGSRQFHWRDGLCPNGTGCHMLTAHLSKCLQHALSLLLAQHSPAAPYFQSSPSLLLGEHSHNL